jgi:hypothetical protein
MSQKKKKKKKERRTYLSKKQMDNIVLSFFDMDNIALLNGLNGLSPFQVSSEMERILFQNGYNLFNLKCR